MAKYVTLDELKEQTNVEHSQDDRILQIHLDAAEAWVEKTIQRSLKELEFTPEDGGEPTIPEPLRMATLIFAAGLYSNREPVAFGGAPVAIPYNLNSMIVPYINFE